MESKCLFQTKLKKTVIKNYKMNRNTGFYGESLVMTTEGLKKVKELVGVEFKSVSLNRESNIIRGFTSLDSGPSVILELKEHSNIRMTLNNSVIINVNGQYQKCEVGDLSIGDEICLCTNTCYTTRNFGNHKQKIIDLIENANQRDGVFIFRDGNLNELQIFLMSIFGISSKLINHGTELTADLMDVLTNLERGVENPTFVTVEVTNLFNGNECELYTCDYSFIVVDDVHFEM